MATVGMSVVCIALGAGVALAVAAALERLAGRAADGETKGRLGELDGLRGYLALAVFVYHFFVTHAWRNGAPWPAPIATPLKNLGEVGVSVFFLITGFLFIHRLRARGTPSSAQGEAPPAGLRLAAWRREWTRFLVRRSFRIYPLYLSALAVILGVTVGQLGWGLHEAPLELGKQLVQWLGFRATRLNGFDAAPVLLARVEWTLRYEWVFYLSLPFVSLALSRPRALAVVATSAALVGAIWPVGVWLSFVRLESHFFLLFVLGGWLAEAKLRAEGTPLRRVDWRSRWIALAALVAVSAVVFGFETAYGPIQFFLLAAFLLPVVLDNTLFGVLAWPASRVLGRISYSIYLIHGLVLWVVFSALVPGALVEVPSERAALWLPGTAGLVTATAWLTHRWIEAPGMALGRRWPRRR